MILLSWISKQKAGEPMSERKSEQELDFEQKHKEDLQRIREFRLIDDDFLWLRCLKTTTAQSSCSESS